MEIDLKVLPMFILLLVTRSYYFYWPLPYFKAIAMSESKNCKFSALNGAHLFIYL